MTQVIVDALREGGPLRCYNWSRGKPLSGLRWKAARIWGAFLSFARILLGKKRQNEIVYYPASSDWGQLYDLLILPAARLRGYKIVLHHHTYASIDRRDWRKSLLVRILDGGCCHVVHCEQMRDDFLARYPTDGEFLFLPPTIVSQDFPPMPRSRHEKFTLGFLSNLTLAKGLDSVLATFARLVDSGRNVALIIAGPCRGAQERRMIDEALKKWPRQMEYRGPVYQKEKGRFFADIDVFLFPTRNESWGIVLTEALSADCPVIACRRGCIPWIVRDGCGMLVEQPADFAHQASQTITHWMDDEQAYETARQLAGRRAKTLEQVAKSQFAYFLKRIREL